MQAFRVIVTIVLSISPSLLRGQTNNDSIQKMEAAGDAAGARAALARAVDASPDDLNALTRYAEFLERYGDPGARAAYEKVVVAARRAGAKDRVASAARRLA